MSDLKIFSETIPLNNKRVIVRLDLNVPLENSKIKDYTRIKVVQEFLIKLIEKKAKIILISHLGRPKGKIINNMSLKPVLEYFEEVNFNYS